MKLKLILIFGIGLFMSSLVYSQDIHYTNYNYAPLYLSPAKTGAFAGTYRFGANVREQFSSFIIEPYTTLMAFADMNIAEGLKPHHWLGAGINVYTDKAGDLSYKNTGAHLSLAYHYAIDPEYKTVISIGLQYGLVRRNINADNYNSEITLSQSVKGDPDLDLLTDFNPTIGDLNIGINLKRWTSENAYLDIGAAANHLLQEEFAFGNSIVQNPVTRRINVYAEYHIQTSKQVAIKPSIVFMRMAQFQNIIGQFNIEYRPNRKKATLIKGGIGYRSGDALQFLAGMIYRGWDIGIAYDLTVSSAAEFTNRIGGLELGVKKILVKNTKPKMAKNTKTKPKSEPPAILCPKF